MIRFRNRYYRFYNHWDSYPKRLGKDIAREIPTDPAAYQEWLAQQRQQALEWHNALELFLCRNDVAELYDAAVSQQHWSVPTEGIPDCMPALNDIYIEWVYTIDLDNEVFTINNSAHVHLIRAADLAWISALTHGVHGDKILLLSDSTGKKANAGIIKKLPEPSAGVSDDHIVLSDSIQKEANAGIMIEPPEPSAGILDAYTNLGVKMVQAKGLDGFSPSHRHGPLLRFRIFYFFRDVYEPYFTAVLLSWRSEDLIFRDIAYLALCLASADLYPSIVSGRDFLRNAQAAFAALSKEGSEKDEFISDLGVGSHLKNVFPGSSPDSELYWFGSVLVHLVADLIDRDDILKAAVVAVVEYCRKERPNQRVDAVLMSIEHVVLMTVESDGQVRRTEALYLFDIPVHTSMSLVQRYSEDELEELQISHKKAIEDKTTSHVDSWPAVGLMSPYLGRAEAGFMALAFFLESSSRRHVQASRTREGVFSIDVYRMILLNIEDVETQRACMQVSQNFRDLCQEDILMMDKLSFRASEATKTYESAKKSLFPALRMHDRSTGRFYNVDLQRTGFHPHDVRQMMKSSSIGLGGTPKIFSGDWQLVFGSEPTRRSGVTNLLLGFEEV